MSGGKILTQIEIELRDEHKNLLPLYINVNDSHLSSRWATALKDLVVGGYHLEKNYCFFGFAQHRRDGNYILDQVNRSISAINASDLGYHIHDHFDLQNVINTGEIGVGLPGRTIKQERLNRLHRYFEDLQGTSNNISEYYQRASPEIRWHIRQLNLLCHEFESWALSHRKQAQAPRWQRPSQLMCWLNAPRFILQEADYDLFGVDTISRGMGEVFVGVNKAVGKHHWEVFNDEGRDSRIDELVTSTLRPQTEAAGDFDIEWGSSPRGADWQEKRLDEFRQWLKNNGFDPEDPKLTIGHPKVAQVDLDRSFGTQDFFSVLHILNDHLDVWSVSIDGARAEYNYSWDDPDYHIRQIEILQKGRRHEMDHKSDQQDQIRNTIS